RERLAQNDAARNVENRIQEDRVRAARQVYREENAKRASSNEDTIGGGAIGGAIDEETATCK
ncbi:MAG: hypothetical protein C4338_01120, partial [Rhodanobacteraceae bacterium]